MVLNCVHNRITSGDILPAITLVRFNQSLGYKNQMLHLSLLFCKNHRKSDFGAPAPIVLKISRTETLDVLSFGKKL
jgi:hypothetical protein